MAKQVLAIVGSYRKGKVIDSAVDAVLAGAAEAGAQTEKIYLIDAHIEFCDNCRACCQQPGKRGACRHRDDMDSILDKIERFDAIVFASPMNAFTVTAVTKRFIERMLVYAYWPWGQPGPKMRPVPKNKKAVIVVSSAMPAIFGRLFVSQMFRLLKGTQKAYGAKVIKTLNFGMVAQTSNWTLPERCLNRCRRAGKQLVTP